MDPTVKRHILQDLFYHYPHLQHIYRSYEAALIKSQRRKHQLQFLKECQAEQVLPHCYSHLLKSSTSGHPFPDYARSFLDDRITCSSLEVNQAYADVRRCYNQLNTQIPLHMLQPLSDVAHDTSRLASSQHSRSLQHKLQHLIADSPWSSFSLSDNVINLSSHMLSSDQLHLLGFGLSFSLRPSPHAAIEATSDLDRFAALHRHHSSVIPTLKYSLVPALKTLFTADHHLPRRFHQALASLQRHQDITIFPSDKGNSVVLLDTSDYIDKAHSLLSDLRTYSPLRSNPLSRISEHFHKKLRLLSESCPNMDLYSKFRVFTPTLPYFYGLPKIHKPGTPLRPIISTRGSVTHPLASWLASILSPYLSVLSPSHLKHSQDFINHIRPIPPTKMLSLDVFSLFTNVPLNETHLYIERKIEEGIIIPPIPSGPFIQLIRLCVESNSFSFHGNYYTQIFGVAMGSPLSPVLAGLWMCHIETDLLPSLNPRPSLWLRYVDDVFALWPHDPELFPTFLDELNHLAPSTRFTVEWEDNNKLPFLDTLVHREAHHFSFSVYRKPTHSGMYIHFFSYHPLRTKISVLSSLFLRAFRLCDPCFLDEEISFLRSSFSRLAYPPHIISQALSRAKKTHFTPRPSPLDHEDRPAFLSLPFIQPLQPLQNKLRPDIHVAFRQTNTIKKNLVHTRPRDDNPPSSGVYSIPCADCPSQYIGMTGRTLEKRKTEHQRDVRKADPSNALFCHLRDYQHRIDWNSARILFSSQNYFTRRLVESAEIATSNNFNLKAGDVQVDPVLASFIHNVIHKTRPPD